MASSPTPPPPRASIGLAPDRLLPALMAASDEAILVTDGAGRILEANPTALRVLGLAPGEESGENDALPESAPAPLSDPAEAAAAARGRPAFALLDPKVAQVRLECLRRVASCGVHETLEDQHDGCWWSVRLFPLAPEPGDPGPLVLLLIRDISEARGLGLAWSDSEERFHSAFDAAGHGMALIGLDGRFRMVNPTLRHLLGIDPEHPGDLAAVIFPGDIKVALDLVRRLGSGQERDLSLRMRFLDAQGEILWGLVTATLHRPRFGETPYVVMHLRDVTEETRADANLRAAKEEADRASRAKTRFLAAASHDLRQPLQALSMFVSVLATREQDPQNAAIVARVEKTLEALTGLLNTLLDISKLDAGLMRCEARDLSLAGLIARLAEEFHPVAAARGLAFRAVGSSGLAHADPALVEIVLRNFLGNALRYTPEGRVLFGARRRAGGVLELQVLDTGPGIPESQFGLIFEDFHQVENPAREKGEGLGLGLGIAKRVATLLGARLTVASRPGRGSCFGLVLPPPLGLATHDPEGGLMRADPLAAQGLTVMLVDDDPAILEGLTLLMEQWDCEVLAFADIAGLKEGLESGGLLEAPDLIIADYRLTGSWTGVDAVEMLREHVGQPVPALLLTGDTAPQRLREADASGLPLLHKPVRPETLRSAIADLITGGLTLDPM